MANSPFTLLQEVVNPLLADVSFDESPSSDPLIKLFAMREAPMVKQATAMYVDLFAYKSKPAVAIGIQRTYVTGTRDMEVGNVQGFYITQRVTVSEDQYIRIRQNASAAVNIIGSMVVEQMKQNNAYNIKEIRRIAVSGLATTELEYINLVKMLGAGTGGTLTDPYDMNATPGAALNLSALKFTGSQQTANNYPQLMTQVLSGMVVQDSETGFVVPVSNIHVGMDVHTYMRMKTGFDIMNSTTGQRHPMSYLSQFEADKITVISDVVFDDYAGADGDTSVLTFFANPGVNCIMFYNPSSTGEEAWSEWTQREQTNGDVTTYYYERHKSLELAFWPQAYWVNSAGKYYKTVFRVTIMPYDNTA